MLTTKLNSHATHMRLQIQIVNIIRSTGWQCDTWHWVRRTAAHDMHIALYILFHLLSAEAAPAEPSWGGGMEAFSSVSSFVRASRHSPLPWHMSRPLIGPLSPCPPLIGQTCPTILTSKEDSFKKEGRNQTPKGYAKFLKESLETNHFKTNFLV